MLLPLFYISLFVSFGRTKAWNATPFAASRRTALSASMTVNINAGRPMPKLPLPEPICSTTPGTWAYDTMSRRVDEEILARTYEENKAEFESDEFKNVLQRFEALRKDLQSAATTKLTYLDDLPDGASEERVREWNEWKQLLQPFVEAGDTLAHSTLDGDRVLCLPSSHAILGILGQRLCWIPVRSVC